jgi:hypothetical protein
MAAQELQLLYARSHDLADAQRRLWRILDRCARSDAPELLRLARTLDAWHEELLAYWTATGNRGVSNGPTEATNALIKKVKDVGHGFRNFDNYRLRLLLTVGLDWRTVHWQAPPATPGKGPLTTLSGVEPLIAGLARRSRTIRTAPQLVGVLPRFWHWSILRWVQCLHPSRATRTRASDTQPRCQGRERGRP